MSEKKRKVFYLYSQDPSMIEVDGKKVANPLPKNLRQRRQVIAGVIQGDNLVFGKSECSHLDIFRKVTGRNKASGLALSTPIATVSLQGSTKDIGKIFVDKAKMLITPGPAVEMVTKVIYKKARV